MMNSCLETLRKWIRESVFNWGEKTSYRLPFSLFINFEAIDYIVRTYKLMSMCA
ncbi:hypothetical protein YC2023_036534 [Brassica napus]